MRPQAAFEAGFVNKISREGFLASFPFSGVVNKIGLKSGLSV